MAVPTNVKNAITTLYGAVAALAPALTDYPLAVVSPGAVNVPTPFQLATSADLVPHTRVALSWPAAAYSEWRSAWEILAGYAGWWGPRAVWPLGDGLAARGDVNVAAKLPTVYQASQVLTNALHLFEEARINPWALGAPFIFAGGLATAIIQGMKWFDRMKP